MVGKPEVTALGDVVAYLEIRQVAFEGWTIRAKKFFAATLFEEPHARGGIPDSRASNALRVPNRRRLRNRRMLRLVLRGT